MPDYPAHLAGFYLIAGGAKSSFLSSFYRIEWAFIPNLGSELVVPVLAGAVGLNIAAKTFLSTAVAMWVFGPAAIHRALFGRVGLSPLVAALFAYNANFMWGFLNYYFAAGLTLLAFAAWIATTRNRSFWRTASFTAAATIIYFCHLFGAALLFLLIFCFELQSATYRRSDYRTAFWRAAEILMVFLPILLAFIFLTPPSSGGPVTFDFAETWPDRFGAMIQSSFDRPAWILLGVLILLLSAGFWRRAIIIHPAMRLVLIVVAACAAIAPEWAMGGWGVYLRLPGVLGALIFASLDIRLPSKCSAVVAAAAVAIICHSAVVLAGNWRYYDRQYAEFDAAAARFISNGSHVVTVLDGDAMGWASDPPYWHMAELEIPTRQIFTPLMFATPGQHIVRVRPPFDGYAATSAWQGSPPDISELDDLAAGRTGADKDIDLNFPYLKFFPCHFKEAVVIHSGGRRSEAPSMLRLQHRGSFFDLYQIRRTTRCAKR